MKKCNKETNLGLPGEREDEEAVTDKINYEEIDLTGEPTEQQSLDRRTIDMLLKTRMSTIMKTTWKMKTTLMTWLRLRMRGGLKRREWSAGLWTRWTCTKE